MITLDTYQTYLNNKGKNLSEVRKNNAAMVMNVTFTGDVGYKRVYILDPDKGWNWTDAKYSEHTKQSIAKDDVDYYLQFRPYEHHPVGTYVFIPNDTSSEIGFANINEDNCGNPFKDDNFQEIFDAGKLWMLVDRNNGTEFVRYMCISCNWLFKWIAKHKGETKVMQCYGMTRSQSDYTSGIWSDQIGTYLDTVTAAFMPDIYYLYGDKFNEYGFDDTRYLQKDMRFMLTLNKINPATYRLSKINDLQPKGVLKFTFKMDEYDEQKDNVDLMICDYYNDDGDVIIDPQTVITPDTSKISSIISAKLNTDNSLVKDTVLDNTLSIGTVSYFIADFSDTVENPEWRISYVNTTEVDENLPDERKQYYCGLLKISTFGQSVVDGVNISSISIRPNKVKSLVGKKFNLTVQNHDGEYKSSIELEVTA